MCGSSIYNLIVPFTSMDDLQDSRVSVTSKDLFIRLVEPSEYNFFIKMGKWCYLYNRKASKTEYFIIQVRECIRNAHII